jgi:Domain of unknown function (DUF222)
VSVVTFRYLVGGQIAESSRTCGQREPGSGGISIESNMRSNEGMVPVPGIASARGGVGSLVDLVRAGGLTRASHDELSGLVRDVRRLQAQLEFVALAVVREVEVRGSHVADGALSTAAWVRLQARMSPGEATAAVRTARMLGSGSLPGTAAALAAGDIDPAHVRAVAAGVADAPAAAVALIEDEALAVAREADPRAVAGLLRRFAHALDPDAADAAALARFERRGITLSPLPDGTVHIRGLADEVTGAVLLTAIDAAGPPIPGDRRTAAQRRVDALADVCRRYLGSPDAPMSGGGHAHVLVTVDADTLGHAGRADGASGPGGTLCWVGPIAGSTAQRVACDADLTVVAVDDHGGAEVVGRQRRFFSRAQRQAMIARDGDRCVVPFCDRPVGWADAHHLVSWASGGPTTAVNGALPCAGHHTLLHEGGWTLHRTPGGYLIRHRDGRSIGPEPYPPGHNRPPPRPP